MYCIAKRFVRVNLIHEAASWRKEVRIRGTQEDGGGLPTFAGPQFK